RPALRWLRPAGRARGGRRRPRRLPAPGPARRVPRLHAPHLGGADGGSCAASVRSRDAARGTPQCRAVLTPGALSPTFPIHGHVAARLPNATRFSSLPPGPTPVPGASPSAHRHRQRTAVHVPAGALEVTMRERPSGDAAPRTRGKVSVAVAAAPEATEPAAPLDGIPADELPPPEPATHVPPLNLQELKEKKIGDLALLAKEMHIESAAALRRQELIFAILQAQAELNGAVSGGGGLAEHPDRLAVRRRPRPNSP